MYIKTIYDFYMENDPIYELNEYFESFKVNVKEKEYQILVTAKGIFEISEYDLMKNFNIIDFYILENGKKINIPENLKNNFKEAIELAIDNERFYYGNYDNGEIYFTKNTDEEGSEKLANLFKKYILK